MKGLAGLAKDFRPMVKTAKRAGWTVEIRNSGHVRWTHPDGQFVTSSQTPSDHQAIRNLRRDLQRMGLQL